MSKELKRKGQQLWQTEAHCNCHWSGGVPERPVVREWKARWVITTDLRLCGGGARRQEGSANSLWVPLLLVHSVLNLRLSCGVREAQGLRRNSKIQGRQVREGWEKWGDRQAKMQMEGWVGPAGRRDWTEDRTTAGVSKRMQMMNEEVHGLVMLFTEPQLRPLLRGDE